MSKHDYVSSAKTVNIKGSLLILFSLFAAQFGGINPSLYLNPEEAEKEVIFSTYGLIIMPEAFTLQQQFVAQAFFFWHPHFE